ncbi:5-(carboxyamino)imidazole ribonucleotide synthase [Marinicella gelatinilytica]|uniref:5-(carboxyamino)imidazole ribonucleotide synthase n=1 Tax=Marinicella gelatinilytica TaxID=2996017 RepID=UPI002260C4A9|nr:5-(carboxyamino)imidazole ribonucleotide synthase [Marinicella gelatinilytica]MCX7544791.1 5-(carboxyamino)imidazole ribonucleotide synthase [Marinicella gelatinilytica]
MTPTIGILGGGQLARMMALAGYPLGFNFVFFDPKETACAGQVGRLISADYDNEIAIEEFCQQVDLVTLDFENVPVDTLRNIAKKKPVFPSPDILAIAQDRLLEKQFCHSINVPTAEFEPINGLSELKFAAKKFGFSAILKTRRMGYDGKGQYLIKNEQDLTQIPGNLFEKDLILEQLVPFEREVSVIVARSQSGDIKTWPLCENKHKEGILTTTMVPAKPNDLDATAFEYAIKMAESLQYVGVMVIEFFQTKDQVLVNEFAPRVHNSGHWTIEGAHTSQFENHLRAGLDLPLGDTGMDGMAAMLNWIGAFPDQLHHLTDVGLYWHVYGKQPKPGRKIGHATLTAPDPQQLHDKILQLVNRLGVQL